MVDPPLEVGAVKAMLALALPAVAKPMVGAPGTVAAKALTVKPANAEKPAKVKTFFKTNIDIFIELFANYPANGLRIPTCWLPPRTEMHDPFGPC
jgi:hypothetical protein